MPLDGASRPQLSQYKEQWAPITGSRAQLSEIACFLFRSLASTLSRVLSTFLVAMPILTRASNQDSTPGTF